MKEAILYIGRFNFPDGSAAAQRVKSNAELFKLLGYKTKFISTWQDGNFYNEENGMNINQIPQYQQIYKIDFIKKYIASLSSEYCIKFIVLYNYPSISSWRLIKFARKNNIKIIGDVTEWFGMKTGQKGFLQIYKNIDTKLRMKIVLNKFDGLFVISKFLEDAYKNTNKTLYLPNLYNPNEEKWSILKHEKKLSKEIIQFTYAGNPGELFEKEDLSGIVNAFNDLNSNNKVLNIIGINEIEYKLRYKNIYRTEPKVNNSIFHGKLTHENTLQLVYNSHFFIYVRPDTIANKAGFPTKFLESIVLETPVLTNDVGDVKLYVHNNINGMIINTDELSLKNLIEEFKINDTLEYKFENNFTINNFYQSTKKFLENLGG
ncbi:glycosyltransferase [Chryseomicrobium imtechense]